MATPTPTADPTPTLRPTASPTGTPSATPTAATATPTAAHPSPTPTPISTATPTPAPTPTPSATPPSTTLFLADDTNGIAEYDARTGASRGTFGGSAAVQMRQVALDDAGNAYALGYLTQVYGGGYAVARYPIGANAPSATYAFTSSVPQTIGVAPSGEVVVSGTQIDSNNDTAILFDVWDPGASGAPSRTLSYPYTSGVYAFLAFALAPDGTLYVGYTNQTQVAYDVYEPGASKPIRTIVDTAAPDPGQFYAQAMTVASDGTLYAGEYDGSGDTNAGLYVYPASGAETFLSQPAPGIVAIDLDASGNVYLASDDAQGPFSNDTSEQMSVYSPRAQSLVRQFDDGLPGVQSLTAGNDGSVYLVQCGGCVPNAPTNGTIAYVAPQSSSPAPLIADTDTENVALLTNGVAKAARRRTFYAKFGSVHVVAPGRSSRRRARQAPVAHDSKAKL